MICRNFSRLCVYMLQCKMVRLFQRDPIALASSMCGVVACSKALPPLSNVEHSSAHQNCPCSFERTTQTFYLYQKKAEMLGTCCLLQRLSERLNGRRGSRDTPKGAEPLSLLPLWEPRRLGSSLQRAVQDFRQPLYNCMACFHIHTNLRSERAV